MQKDWDDCINNQELYPQMNQKSQKSVYETIKKLTRPRIDYLPKEIISQIKILEEQFQKYQNQLKTLPDFDITKEPKLEIPPITEAYIKVNDPSLSPAERSNMMLQIAFGFQMQ